MLDNLWFPNGDPGFPPDEWRKWLTLASELNRISTVELEMREFGKRLFYLRGLDKHLAGDVLMELN